MTADTTDVSALAPALAACEKGGRKDRWTGTVRSFDRFTLFVPDSARILRFDSAGAQLSLAWPRCTDACRFHVGVFGDSGVSLDARVARLVAEQRRIDSLNNAPGVGVMEFDVINGPPRPFTTGAGQGYEIEGSCGDCGVVTFMLGRAGRIANVTVSADAAPGAGERMCEMTAVAKTFAWRRE